MTFSLFFNIFLTLSAEGTWASRWLSSKESTCKAGATGNVGSIPGSVRSPGGGHGNSLQYSCLEILRTENPGRLQSTGSQIVCYDWRDLACTHTQKALDFLFYWPYHSVCGILILWLGIQPLPSALEAEHLNHWTTIKVPWMDGIFKEKWMQ